VPGSNALLFRIPSTNNASDPRDFIYGMLDLLPRRLSVHANVDYSPTCLFVDVMRALPWPTLKARARSIGFFIGTGHPSLDISSGPVGCLIFQRSLPQFTGTGRPGISRIFGQTFHFMHHSHRMNTLGDISLLVKR